MTSPYIDLSDLADLLTARAANNTRVVVAIPGAPGSGKSTMLDQLAARLNARQSGFAMDGFHYDDLHIVPAGQRPRKGAPDTFDFGRLRHTLERIRARSEASGQVNLPILQGIAESADTIFTRLIIQSDSDQIKAFEFGFSDCGAMFLNGNILFHGMGAPYTRDYRFLGTVALYDKVFLNLI